MEFFHRVGREIKETRQSAKMIRLARGAKLPIRLNEIRSKLKPKDVAALRDHSQKSLSTNTRVHMHRHRRGDLLDMLPQGHP